MVVDQVQREQTDRVFHALADATRRDIVALTLHGEHSVSALARRYPMSVTAVQKHVAVLERAGLVTRRRNGREQLVHAEIASLRGAHHLLDRLEVLWRDRIDRLGDLLAEPHPNDTPPSDHRGAHR